MTLAAYARLIFRGWLIVALTALNVKFISGGNYAGGFVAGSAISLTWWGNSKQATQSSLPGGRWCYALGAGLGTLTGMYIGGLKGG